MAIDDTLKTQPRPIFYIPPLVPDDLPPMDPAFIEQELERLRREAPQQGDQPEIPEYDPRSIPRNQNPYYSND